jgi:hypothetical protein
MSTTNRIPLTFHNFYPTFLVQKTTIKLLRHQQADTSATHDYDHAMIQKGAATIGTKAQKHPSVALLPDAPHLQDEALLDHDDTNDEEIVTAGPGKWPLLSLSVSSSEEEVRDAAEPLEAEAKLPCSIFRRHSSSGGAQYQRDMLDSGRDTQDNHDSMFWSLKRANPIQEQEEDDDDLIHQYESPTKRQCTTVLYDDDQSYSLTGSFRLQVLGNGEFRLA